MADPRAAERDRTSSEEPPPILGRWTWVYAWVLIALAVEITVFWMLTKVFG